MSYTPTEWKTGDVVTAERLNKLENGVADSGCLIVHASHESTELSNNWTLDKTANEIIQHIPLVYCVERVVNPEDETQYTDTYYAFALYGLVDGWHMFQFTGYKDHPQSDDMVFLAENLTDYPVCSIDK